MLLIFNAHRFMIDMLTECDYSCHVACNKKPAKRSLRRYCPKASPSLNRLCYLFKHEDLTSAIKKNLLKIFQMKS